MAETAKMIETKLKAYRIIHLIMVISSVVYGVMIVYIDQYAPIPPTITDVQTLTTIEYMLIFTLLSLIAITVLVRKEMLGSDKIFKKRATAKKLSEQPPFIANYLSSLFVVWSLIEAIAISGIVLFLVSGKLMMPLTLISIAVFFKLFNGPRREELTELASKHRDLTCGVV